METQMTGGLNAQILYKQILRDKIRNNWDYHNLYLGVFN
jgi:hypothetical protein